MADYSREISEAAADERPDYDALDAVREERTRKAPSCPECGHGMRRDDGAECYWCPECGWVESFTDEKE